MPLDRGTEAALHVVREVENEIADELRGADAFEQREIDLAMLELDGTDFQRRCWLALATIPYGQTVSYGEQARRLGLGPASARAVGAANGQNPLPIVLPCHRVVASDGRLTGYVLLALPAFLSVALMFINPDHMNLLFRERMGQLMLMAAIVMQTIGFLWIKQVVKIEV